MADAPVKAVPAATVLLIRDGSGETKGEIEVFMIQRTRAVDFVPGALVFPGGKVDARDSDEDLHQNIRGKIDEWLPFEVAAVREAFEECGVLLAYQEGSDEIIHQGALDPLLDYGAKIEAGEESMLSLANAGKLEFALDHLVRFAHWITPEPMPRRYDTHFYLAIAPSDQTPVHNGGEAVESVWITPARAVADGEAGERQVILPTREVLKQLGRSKSVAEAIGRAHEEKIVTVLPVPEKVDGKNLLRIPKPGGDGTVLMEFDLASAIKK